ncbi:MAG: hypothetical protein EXR69_03445 [Myxococcales bacterium]|nr:hypothetical protein [Myxococcales bacterium]
MIVTLSLSTLFSHDKGACPVASRGVGVDPAVRSRSRGWASRTSACSSLATACSPDDRRGLTASSGLHDLDEREATEVAAIEGRQAPHARSLKRYGQGGVEDPVPPKLVLRHQLEDAR